MAFFEGLVVDEMDRPLRVEYLGSESFYVVNDQGFQRYVEASPIDTAVLGQFVSQLSENSEEASRAMLQMMGQDDLFTKAMIDAQLRNLDIQEIRQRRLPTEARRLLAMVGFRIVLDVHGNIINVNLPAAPDGDEQ